MTRRVRSVLDELAAALSRLYGTRLDRLVLFGSHARGDARRGSDIDVLVVLRGDLEPGVEIGRTGGITSVLSLQHDVVLSLTFVTTERYRDEHSPLMLNVRREGVAL